MSGFGENLKALREAVGWSQERVGLDIGVTKATISKWETGRAEPSLDNLIKIRILFRGAGVTLDHLLMGQQDFVYSEAKPAPSVAEIREAGDWRPSPNAATTYDEIALLARFRALRSRQRKALLELITGLGDPEPAPSID